MEAIEDKVRRIVRTSVEDLELGNIEDYKNLATEGVDKLGFRQIVMNLEHELGIELDNSDFAQFNKIADIISIVKEKQE